MYVGLGNHYDLKSYNGENSYIVASANTTKMFVVTHKVPNIIPNMTQAQKHNQDL